VITGIAAFLSSTASSSLPVRQLRALGRLLRQHAEHLEVAIADGVVIQQETEAL